MKFNGTLAQFSHTLLPSVVLVVPFAGETNHWVDVQVEHTLQLSLLVSLIEGDWILVVN